MSRADAPPSLKDGAAHLGEFGRIARYLAPLAVLPGADALQDDAALLDVPPGGLVVTTDAIVEGVHYLPGDPPESLAAKLVRVNLSDLTAKGARALAYTLTLALPRRCDDRWVAAFARGLADEQARYGWSLIGGDSVGIDGPAVLSLTAFGVPGPGGVVRRRRRDPAACGLYVTGTLGGAAFGLAALRGMVPPEPALIAAYRIPEPPVGLAGAIARHAAAALDVSDGLVADAGHMAMASGLALALDAPALPLADAVAALVADDPDGGLMTVLTGGDDYQTLLLATDAAGAALTAEAARLGLRLTRIGQVVEGAAGSVTVRDRDGAALPLRGSGGWRHG